MHHPRRGKPVVGRGWCARHYGIWRTYGDPLHPVRKYRRQGEKCTEKDCPDKPVRNGMCHKHARRMEVHGTTVDPREPRFWAQVDRHGDDECWPWTGYCQPNGYGTRSTHRRETRLVHRIAYEYLVGPIPDGLVLDHLCHTRDPGTMRELGVPLPLEGLDADRPAVRGAEQLALLGTPQPARMLAELWRAWLGLLRRHATRRKMTVVAVPRLDQFWLVCDHTLRLVGGASSWIRRWLRWRELQGRPWSPY